MNGSATNYFEKSEIGLVFTSMYLSRSINWRRQYGDQMKIDTL